MFRLFAAATVSIAAAIATLTPAAAQSAPGFRPPSTCLAVADYLHDDGIPVQYAAAGKLGQYEVAISYEGHSMYMIETASGERIVTDYAGYTTDPRLPTLVPMNRAHSSPYTLNPAPKNGPVLPGWGEDGAPADHQLEVNDVLVRNVTTDILRFGTVKDGNSIFIFEVAGLCSGHLGHLHHRLTDEHIAKIGRLDVVMIPVDGGLTLSHDAARAMLDQLRSSVILPMHVRFAGALPRFLQHLNGYPVRTISERQLVLSLRTLPKTPTIMLLPGVSFAPRYFE